MAKIQQADYETIRFTCDHCASPVLLNRVSDLDEPGPYSGRNAPCESCGALTWINGDVAGSPFEMFIHDADSHFKKKRYMLAVAVTAQAWELLLSSFMDSTFVFRPFFQTPTLGQDLKEMNTTWRLLQKATARFAFHDLRNVLLHIKTKGIEPRTLGEAREIIPTLVKLTRDVPKKSFAAIGNASVRDLLISLKSVTVGELRNRVVHQGAYRPNRAEAQQCLEPEVVVMFRLEQELGIGTFHEFAAGVVPKPANSQLQPTQPAPRLP